ncbi:MAG: xanthine dehydrogenase family protein subunit M [Pirellulales bacterium]|nr:xanthine dehydrogenase family protein subunit M [Pirellulales bacterium]
MQDFSYAAATTIDEAVSLLSAGGDRARVLAGGTDIIVQLREGLRSADLVVDVKKIPELMALDFDPARGLLLGAAVPCYRLYDDERIAAAYPALVDSARIIGGWQIQGRASIGGNLCNSSPAADSIPSLIALGATCRIAGPAGTREVPVAEFCTAPGRNCLARGEFLVSLVLPAPRGGSAYLRFIPRNEMDIAVVGVGAWVELDPSGQKIADARIALAAVAPTPVVAAEAGKSLVGQPASEASFKAAGEAAKKVARPITDRRGPADYRTHLVGVLTQRVLATAVERAKSKK